PPVKNEKAERSGLTTIKEIRRTVLADAVRVVIELDAEVEFRQDRIDGPPRVFVDLSATRATPALIDKTIRFESDADVVRQVRVGRHPNNTTRIVLDTTGVSSYSVYPLYGPYRLVIDCMRASGIVATSGVVTNSATAPRRPPVPTAAAAPPPPPLGARQTVPSVRREPASLAARPVASDWLRAAPAITPQHSLMIAEARAPVPEPLTTAPVTPSKPPETAVAPQKPADASRTTDPAAAPAAKNGNGGFSIARQLGLGVSRIVIDPGHGGHDPGAQARGIVEAELVLDIALRVEKLLQKTPGVEVVLTRRTDEFIALQERTAIANREGADLFLSIHANASSSAQAHGIETYFLNFASNLSAAAVAARENAASGQAMNALPDIVKAIALNNKLDESRDFATQIQHSMVETLAKSNKTTKDLGVKQAPFVVLIGAAMPSVLAEISFVTNPQEARLLKNNNYRQRIAEALFNAIRKYQASLKSITTLAQ
ncbi:MAG TPA: N-acetylmuramoyl-L-alanine amidase, partial [Vicinamibacterales bacterium]